MTKIEQKKPIYTKEMQKRGDLPKVGMMVTIQESSDIWGDCAHLVGCPVTVMATFTGLGKDLSGTNIPMVAVSIDNGSSACFRADMCQPIDTRTDEEKAIDDIRVQLKNLGSLLPINFVDIVKNGKIHGVKWVGK